MKPTFIMMVGLPGSGKSTYAAEFAVVHDATIFSSDALREEMFKDVNHQADNTKLFEELHRRIKDCLKDGKNAIMDATNINYKRRMAFLAELKNIPCEKICVLIATPYKECLKRNAERERKVPEHVIERMYRNFNIPYWYEGWDDIQIEHGDSKGCYLSPLNFYNKYVDYNQNNSHHELTLGKHCLLTSIDVGAKTAYDLTMVFAAIIHDCGKPFCATFKNKKGEITDECHYYDHQYVGAYESLFYDYGNIKLLDIAILIMWHMQPYFNKEEKTKEKYRKLWGEELYNNIMKLHEADESAH